AHASYHWVEVTTRQYLSNKSLKLEIFTIGIVSFFIGAFGVSVKFVEFNNRLPHAVNVAAAEANNFFKKRDECFRSLDVGTNPPGCVVGGEQPAVILIGDSHSYSVVTGLANSLKNKGDGVKYWGLSSCPTIKGVFFTKLFLTQEERCNDFNDWVFNQVEELPEKYPLVIVNRTSWYLWGNEFDTSGKKIPMIKFSNGHGSAAPSNFSSEFNEQYVKTICDYTNKRKVFLVRPIPEMPSNVPNNLSRSIMFGSNGDDIKITLVEYHKRNIDAWNAQDMAAKKCGAKILNPLPYLCDNEYCYGARNNRPIYFDNNHLSEYGNKLLIPMFEEIFNITND
ncbi:acyltransferase, partial [Patescibacteria group bacterium]|nr:acyltransferase [Patescibacteria group bacterium]